MSKAVRNPMGARGLYLYAGGKDTLYRIHGTNQPGWIDADPFGLKCSSRGYFGFGFTGSTNGRLTWRAARNRDPTPLPGGTARFR
jgi:hypothetical protein